MDDIAVYEILVREHQAMLLAYVAGLLGPHGDRALAEDICQDAFIAGYRKLPTLRKQESFPAWLRAIARNLTFAALRRAGRETMLPSEVMAGMDEVFTALDRAAADQGAAEGGGWAARVQALRACFDQLPEALRDCCQLHYFEGVATAEIATRVRSSLAAVLKRLQRARAALALCISRRLELDDA